MAEIDYAFFTSRTPTATGLDYLVNSPTNPNGLNDAYYAQVRHGEPLHQLRREPASVRHSVRAAERSAVIWPRQPPRAGRVKAGA